MGAGASAPGALEALPDPVTEAAALSLLGDCFDRADWETISGGTGQVKKETFIVTITVRNHAPSLRAWLEFWRIDELEDVSTRLPLVEFIDPPLLERDDEKWNPAGKYSHR